MPGETAIPDLVTRIRAGDESAVRELVERYEDKIRRVVRFNLDRRLQGKLSSSDICQQVMGSFFARLALGQFDQLETADQLAGLLSQMAQRKLINEARYHFRARRDVRRVADGNEEWLPDHQPTPSQEVSARELVEDALRRLSDEERRLLDLRKEGKDWAEIAALLGGSPDALRKKLERGQKRVVEEMHLDE